MKIRKTLIALSLCLFCASQALAQNRREGKPASVPQELGSTSELRESLRPSLRITLPTERPSNPSLSDDKDKEVPASRARPGLGKKFWALWGLAIGTAVADVETTAHCLKRPDCSEANPLLGKRPSRARMYSVKAIPIGLGFYFSQKWKRDKHGETWGWWAPPTVIAGVNGGVAIHNLTQVLRHRSVRSSAPMIANMPTAELVPLPAESQRKDSATPLKISGEGW